MKRLRVRMLCGGLLLVSVLAGGCSKQNDTMQGWIGHHRDDLVKTWGAPAQETALENGGKSIMYISYWSDGYGSYTCRRVFATDAEGIIRSWSVSGC
ncbi:MAG: hypothetical protein HY581_10310 [Nitrospirae bacterium]|nr:hypothetical protein [Nitrospirota bacterium]